MGQDDIAYEKLKHLRWPDGVPVCPKCGSRRCYALKSRPRFRCRACVADFTITSGTIFASHKKPLNELIAAINAFEEGGSIMQLKRALGVQYKTAFVLANKLRAMKASNSVRASREWVGYWQGEPA